VLARLAVAALAVAGVLCTNADPAPERTPTGPTVAQIASDPDNCDGRTVSVEATVLEPRACRLPRVSVARIAAVAIAFAVAGCAADREEPAAPNPEPTIVRITLDPDGSGPQAPRRTLLECPSERRVRACERLQRLSAEAFKPVPREAICTMIYGGPQTARIVGVIDGRPVNARFCRRNGCEIARWERVDPILTLARAP
jgi:hypothetical protein